MNKQKLKELISKDDLEKVIDYLKDEKVNRKIVRDEAILLSGKFENLKKKNRQGIISDNESNLERNKIRLALTELIDKPNIESNKIQRRNLTIIVSILVSIIIGLGFFFEKRNPSNIKVKVFHFSNYNYSNEKSKIGGRFAGAILNHLINKKINAERTGIAEMYDYRMSRSYISEEHEKLKVFENYINSIIPCIIITGYVEEYSDSDIALTATIRLTLHTEMNESRPWLSG